MNTRFSYMYRDGANWKDFYDCVVAGEFSDAQKEAIQNACDGIYFIPGVLGLPGGVWKDDPGYDPQYDHPWCEFDADCDLELTEDPPTVSYSANSLTEAFIACQDKWESLPEKESAELPPRSQAQRNEDDRTMHNPNPSMSADDTVIGHISKNGTLEVQWFKGTPENIASFLMQNQAADQITLTDKFDCLILSAFGCFIDTCPDKALMGKVLEYLVPMQMGEAAPVAFETITPDALNNSLHSKSDPEHEQANKLLAPICEMQFPELYATVYQHADTDLIFSLPGGGYQLVYYNSDATAGGQIVQCPFDASQAVRMQDHDAYLDVLAENTQYLSDINTDHYFQTMFDLLSAKMEGRFLGTDIHAVCRNICSRDQEMQKGRSAFDEKLSSAASRAGTQANVGDPSHIKAQDKEGGVYEK